MLLKSVLIMCMCLVGMGAKADLLIPPMNLFAEKSKDPVKEHVFVWNGDQYSCDSPSAVYFKTEKEAKELCGLCPNRMVERTSGGNISGHLRINGKTYYSCENENCLKCSDEGWCGGELGDDEVKDVYACVSKSIKKCPTNKPLLDTFGFCHSCEEEKGINMSWTIGKIAEEKQMSEVCNNRKMQPVGNRGKDDLYSILNECPKPKPIQDNIGNCYKCDEPKAIYLSGGRHGKPPYGKEQKKDPLCPNRQRIHNSTHLTYSNFSSLKTCPKDMPLRNQDGGCHFCNEKQEVIVGNVVWGTIKEGKVYDENHKLTGYLEKGNDDKKKNEPIPPGLPTFFESETRTLYNLQKEAIGYVKSDFNYVSIYNLKNEKIADRRRESDIPDFDGDYYFRGTFPDKACPNREVKEIFSVLKK